MTTLRTVITTLIAIGALLTPIVRPRKLRRWISYSIVFLVATGGVVQIGIDRKHSKEEAKQRAAQSRMADAIVQLRDNSNEEKAAKASQARSRRQVRKGLQALIDEGVTLRNGCQGVNATAAERKCMGEAEKYLNQIDRNDAKELLYSSEVLPGQPCFSRINAYISVLEKIRNGISSN
ncbi:MAG: hypothetical protein M1404_01280 [Acidobacteria bacterium]|nr:hypothetical protein [Acidobacteriota bacterium]